ncbi:MAG: PDZ domain-containing protein, partial [Chitinophagaceae bacterium]
CVVAGALVALPAFAQPKKADQKEKDVQTIVITRDGNIDEETVIRVKGDKVTVNGKDADKSSDVNVNVNTIKKGRHVSINGIGGRNTWVFSDDEDGHTFFQEDEKRAMLGVVTDLTDKGARVASLTKESAAEKAGLKEGDIITKIDKEAIKEDGDVAKAIRAHKPGDKVSITILRDGKEQTLTAELTKWKGMSTFGTLAPSRYFNMNDFNVHVAPPSVQVGPGNFYTQAMSRPRLGISIQDTEDGKGVKITDVDDDSHGAKAGLKKDDIITRVDDDAIESTDELKRIAARLRQGSALTFQVLRNGKTETVEVKIPRPLKKADL